MYIYDKLKGTCIQMKESQYNVIIKNRQSANWKTKTLIGHLIKVREINTGKTHGKPHVTCIINTSWKQQQKDKKEKLTEQATKQTIKTQV